MAHTDANLVETAYVRNGWGEVIREASPDIGTVDVVRNRAGLVTQQTDGRGIVTQAERGERAVMNDCRRPDR